MREEEYTIPEMVDKVRAGTMQWCHFSRQLTMEEVRRQLG